MIDAVTIAGLVLLCLGLFGLASFTGTLLDRLGRLPERHVDRERWLREHPPR